MKSLLAVFLLTLASFSASASYDVKAVAVGFSGKASSAKTAASNYAFNKIGISSGMAQDIHYVKVAGNMKGADGKTNFKVFFYKVTFTSHVSYKVETITEIGFIDGQILETLQKEIPLFKIEFWASANNGTKSYEVIGGSQASGTRIVKPLNCFCTSVTATVWQSSSGNGSGGSSTKQDDKDEPIEELP